VPAAAASTGSACHAGTTDPSPVLAAMGLDRHHALAAVRLSVGRCTSDQDIDRAAIHLTEAARRLDSRAAI
jgi:cysteine desulfurase